MEGWRTGRGGEVGTGFAAVPRPRAAYGGATVRKPGKARRFGMSGIGRKMRGGVLAAMVAGSLGFGAAEAFARPADTERAAACDPERCDRVCKAQNGPFAHGECWGDECLCAL